MKLLLALAFSAMIFVAIPARAATEYFLAWTNYNPYYTQVVGGPFTSSQECNAIKNQETYRPGGFYSCNMMLR